MSIVSPEIDDLIKEYRYQMAYYEKWESRILRSFVVICFILGIFLICYGVIKFSLR